jgi:hypothetical protein
MHCSLICSINLILYERKCLNSIICWGIDLQFVINSKNNNNDIVNNLQAHFKLNNIQLTILKTVWINTLQINIAIAQNYGPVHKYFFMKQFYTTSCFTIKMCYWKLFSTYFLVLRSFLKEKIDTTDQLYFCTLEGAQDI